MRIRKGKYFAIHTSALQTKKKLNKYNKNLTHIHTYIQHTSAYKMNYYNIRVHINESNAVVLTRYPPKKSKNGTG